MRPILLQGHERALTQVKYNKDGDLLFSVSKDHVICVWYSQNGERLGTYNGHLGAVWTIDSNPSSTILASGAADNTIRLWEIKTGKLLKIWELPTAIKRVEFSEDGLLLVATTEQRMGHLGTILVYPVNPNIGEEQADEPSLKVTLDRSKATVVAWSYLNRYIIAGHEDGTISQYDAETGEQLENIQLHEKGPLIMDIQMAPDRTYFITASKDKSAKIVDVNTLNVIKTFMTDTPLNSAALTGRKDFVILGGGQEARDVTTTATRQGKFEARFYHKIFEDEIGRVKGHFGPLNTIAVHPAGVSYASGGEDGYVRLHHFDKSYFDFMYEVERTRAQH